MDSTNPAVVRKSTSFPLALLSVDEVYSRREQQEPNFLSNEVQSSMSTSQQKSGNSGYSVRMEKHHTVVNIPDGALHHATDIPTPVSSQSNGPSTDRTVPLLQPTTRAPQNTLHGLFDEGRMNIYCIEVLLLYTRFFPQIVVISAIVQQFIFKNMETAYVLALIGLVIFFFGVQMLPMLSTFIFTPKEFLNLGMWFYLWPIGPFAVGRYWYLFNPERREHGICVMIFFLMFTMTNVLARFTSERAEAEELDEWRSNVRYV